MSRSYEGAIATLNSLQSNFSVVESVRKSGNVNNAQAIPEMVELCRKVGYEPSDLDRLNLIHIAGTKGKGSTCAFISSILSQYLPNESSNPVDADTKPFPKLKKIGLFTSPHLRFVRERIQINNEPLTEAQFAKYFFETWDRLEASAKAAGIPPDDISVKPAYFRYLTLMAFHAYMSEGVDAAIIECGIGGELDSTNILVQPKVIGISSLGIDHVAILGSTIEEIAWQKAGIMKSGVQSYTAPQPERALNVLYSRAAEKGAKLDIADGHPELNPDSPSVKLGLSGQFQYRNAQLAAHIVGEFLRTTGSQDIPTNLNSAPLPQPFRDGLANAKLGGRCETRIENDIAWYIDGGHTLESIEATGKWFTSQRPSTKPDNAGPRVLIFNQQARDSVALARALHATLSSGNCTFTHAVFCSNVTFKQVGYRPDLVSINTTSSDLENLSVQKTLAETWKELSPNTEIHVKLTIEEAVQVVRDLAKREGGQNKNAHDEVPVSALVTGSLHLVGGLLEVLETTTTKP